jgi:3-oxoacyl-[acyl-carrier-protein] synthase-3
MLWHLISAACTGFIYALSTAKAFVESGMKKNVLIVGAEKLSNIVDYTDRTTCMLFGDGAGAAVISATENKEEAIVDIQCSADGSMKDLLMTPGVASSEAMFMQMKGNETFKIAVRTLTSDVEKIMTKNGYQNDDIDLFIPHQANYRIIKAVGDALKFKDEQKVLTVAKYGNTSSASIPMAINDCFESGRLKKGDTMLLDAFGGGLTWGSSIVKFNG